jgi:hypothetical protein
MKPDVLKRLAGAKDNIDVQKIDVERESVLSRFSKIFQPDAINTLHEEDFRRFLSFKHNKHWSNLERQVNQVCSDMDGLRRALSTLVDESRSLPDRFDAANELRGLGQAKLSAVLLVAYPERYGIWNGTSEKALKHLGLWPVFRRGATKGEKYEAINQVLLDLAKATENNLWT